jgi:AcrR family transcriptional regulator
MGKGDITRQAILDHAVALASKVGLGGLTIGRMAEDLDLSKSGLFAHFQSKEALQLQTLEAGAARFVDTVVKPGLKAPRGEPRLRALFEHWCHWPKQCSLHGGCLFVQSAAEYDDLPGPVRDLLVKLQKDWLDVLSNAARAASAEGHFRKDCDPEQFAHEVYGVMLMFHHASRLLADPHAARRARTAFEALITHRR